MTSRSLTRRLCFLLPLALAACGGEPKSYPPLRYGYLTQIRLNVADVEVQQRFVASGIAPDVSNMDPIRPTDALKAMAQDRLQPFGASGHAVFVIQDASLIKEGDRITGVMDVVLNIILPDGQRGGFAEARVTQRHTGRIDELRDVLYDMTKSMMDDMNVELEYQIRHNLRDWLVSEDAAPMAVQQAPLDQGPGQPPPGRMPPVPIAPRPVAPPPSVGAPQPLGGVLMPPPGVMPSPAR